MPSSHQSQTDPDLHEPKGVSTANQGAIYVADGAGSGSWSFTTFCIDLFISDISTSGSTYAVLPYDCTVDTIYSVVDGTVTTSDESLTSSIQGVSIVGGTVTIANASTAGTVDSASPTSNNTGTAGQRLQIDNNGASGAAIGCRVTVACTRTA